MRMRVGQQHVLNDPVFIYTPMIFSLICMYFIQYWLCASVVAVVLDM